MEPRVETPPLFDGIEEALKRENAACQLLLNPEEAKNEEGAEHKYYYRWRKDIGLIWAVHDKRFFDIGKYYSWKENPEKEVTAKMAAELTELILRWQVIVPPKWLITIPPQGASFYKTKGQKYPAQILAQEVALRLGLDFRKILTRSDDKKHHHPMASLRQAEYKARPTNNPVILLDDMVRTSNTIKLSMRALRDVGVPVFAFVYVI